MMMKIKLNGCCRFYNSRDQRLFMSHQKKMCLNLAQLIYDSGFLTGIYHGDMNYQERHTVQQQF